MSQCEAPPEAGGSTVSAEHVRLRPRVVARAVRAAVMTAPWVVLVVLLVDGSVEHPWILVLLLVAMMPTVVFRWLVVGQVARRPWAVEISPSGVAWFDSAKTVLWSELERVEVHLTRGWRRLLPHGFDRVLLVRPVEADFADRAGVIPTSPAILLASVRTTPAEVVGAARRFSDVPVRGWPGGR